VLATARLKLIPTTLELTRAEIADQDAFAQQLVAKIPDNWPPETLVDALPIFLSWIEAAPDKIGWFGWYAIADGTLVASGGFKGPPTDGVAEVGYSVLPQFQNHGYATEMVIALVQWALTQPNVSKIVAETEWANPASVRVLQKAGFISIGPMDEGEGEKFEFRPR
jgi:[ribosomal protein S5]-alanine N-acetyltransferase